MSTHKPSQWLDRLGLIVLVSLASAGLLSLILPTLIVIIESFDTRIVHRLSTSRFFAGQVSRCT